MTDAIVPFLDLAAQLRQIRPEIDAAIAGVLDSGLFVLGPAVADFEARFAPYCQAEHCVGVNSGASALHLALLAAGIGPGDEVITVSMTFVATAAAILACGAKPVFVDVEADTWTMAPNTIEAAVTPRTAAILPVHLHGQMADMDAIMAIARRHGLLVIEDAAQAHGAELNGRRAGSIGDIGCFSFYPGKNLGGFGEGGAAVTRNGDFARTMRLMRDWGQAAKYDHALRGFNARMDGLQGAILGVKMAYIEAWTEGRRSAARTYDRRLDGLGLKRPTPRAGSRHVYHVYAIEDERRGDLQRALGAEGVATGIHYPVPVHLQSAYANLGDGPGSLPVTEALAARFLSLPIFPELRPEQVERVCTALERALESSIPAKAMPPVRAAESRMAI